MAANMDEGSEQPTVEKIFSDFKGRRAAIIKALTDDFEDFYQKCDPEGLNLCLYGHPNGRWEVKMPEKETPPEIPDPAMGINLARDGMEKYEWMAFVAVHSDSWLLSVAFFFGAGLDKTDRKRLFDMINDLPTIYKTLFATELKPLGPWTSLVNPASRSTKSKPKGVRGKICGACEEKFETGEFWIRCDGCEKWFHGVCVSILTARSAEKMKNFYCLLCHDKRSLQ